MSFFIRKYEIEIGKSGIKDVGKILLVDEVRVDTRGWKFSREEIYEGWG